MQVHMPTTDHDDDIEQIYEISEMPHQERRAQENAIVMETSTALWEKDLQINW